MWRRVDQLEPAAALGLGAAVGAAVWWAVAAAAPGLAVWAGVALLAAAVVLAFTGQPVVRSERSVTPVGGVVDVPSEPPPAPAVETRPATPRPPGIDTLETYRFAVVTVDERGAVRERREAEALSFAEELGDGVRLEMTFVPGGRFMMGSPQQVGSDSERPEHEVSLGPFYLGRYPVTQAQWRAVARWAKVERDLEPEPSHFKGDDRPVEQVSWHHAVEFCRRLSQRTGRAYALPSEAQWEYACRAGTETPFHFGPTITPAIVNYHGNYPYGLAAKGEYRQQTTQVGGFDAANAFGLFDLHGNVWEWCQDVWHEDYKGAPADGSAWVKGGEAARRVLRGGSWVCGARLCRSAYRLRNGPEDRDHYWGFRVVCAVSRTQ